MHFCVVFLHFRVGLQFVCFDIFLEAGVVFTHDVEKSVPQVLSALKSAVDDVSIKCSVTNNHTYSCIIVICI